MVRLNRDNHENYLVFVSDKRDRMFTPYTAESQYDLEFKCKDQPCGVATFLSLDPIRVYRKIRFFEKDP